jgi:hypothetical protein
MTLINDINQSIDYQNELKNELIKLRKEKANYDQEMFEKISEIQEELMFIRVMERVRMHGEVE